VTEEHTKPSLLGANLYITHTEKNLYTQNYHFILTVSDTFHFGAKRRPAFNKLIECITILHQLRAWSISVVSN